MPEKDPSKMSLNELLAEEQDLRHKIREFAPTGQDEMEKLLNKFTTIQKCLSKFIK